MKAMKVFIGMIVAIVVLALLVIAVVLSVPSKERTVVRSFRAGGRPLYEKRDLQPTLTDKEILQVKKSLVGTRVWPGAHIGDDRAKFKATLARKGIKFVEGVSHFDGRPFVAYRVQGGLPLSPEPVDTGILAIFTDGRIYALSLLADDFPSDRATEGFSEWISTTAGVLGEYEDKPWPTGGGRTVSWNVPGGSVYASIGPGNDERTSTITFTVRDSQTARGSAPSR